MSIRVISPFLPAIRRRCPGNLRRRESVSSWSGLFIVASERAAADDVMPFERASSSSENSCLGFEKEVLLYSFESAGSFPLSFCLLFWSKHSNSWKFVRTNSCISSAVGLGRDDPSSGVSQRVSEAVNTMWSPPGVFCSFPGVTMEGVYPEESYQGFVPFSTNDKEKARCLSDEWSDAFCTYPKFVFNGNNQEDVDDTLLRYKSQGNLWLCYQFEITMTDFNDDVDATRLDKWLKTAVENGVKELKIHLKHPNGGSCYVIPDCILEAKSLTMLSLENCKFPNKMNSNNISTALCSNIHTLELRHVTMDHHTFSSFLIAGKSLTRLSLGFCEFPNKLNNVPILRTNIRSLVLMRVTIDNDSFTSFLAGCPSIEHLRIEYCPKLRKVELINVPSCLKEVEVCGNCYPGLVGFQAHQNLESLKLENMIVNGTFFDGDFGNKFPQLRSLVVWDCHGFAKPKLTSGSLRNLSFSPSDDGATHEVEISAPSLTSFDLGVFGDNFPKVCLMAGSPRLECRVALYFHSVKDRSWFLSLNKMLSGLVPSQISLKFVLRRGFDSDNNGNLSEPSAEVFDGSFLDCCPSTITLHLFDNGRALCMFDSLQQKLIEMHNQGRLKEIRRSVFHQKQEKCPKLLQDNWVSLSNVVCKYCEEHTLIRFELGWNLPSSCSSNTTLLMNQQIKRLRIED
ncbi:OLC1v1020266C1 [Oldenlandia corymbosa var. corymbosa]|uniref:OLC1v1020266C1 n=1 Tax=Oldenlandia corymbosa var. corymbosa TaxID=529605 RepID=A0AAV1EG07_OLDCO|nr:OLC1v1020266C1 [Oldenlandia corymbosa var. corymbosa]